MEGERERESEEEEVYFVLVRWPGSAVHLPLLMTSVFVSFRCQQRYLHLQILLLEALSSVRHRLSEERRGGEKAKRGRKK